MKNKYMYFITGSQDLYGEDTLIQVDKDSREIASYLNADKGNPITIKYYGTTKNNDQIVEAIDKVNFEKDCIGIIVWCHTFSPAKMWINGLKKLNKPLLHLHTQINNKLPYATIDMDFMNLNQAAHGDREFGHVCARLGLKRKVVSGYYKDKSVLEEVYSFARLCAVRDYAEKTKVCRFGDNMRNVAVTDGDKVSAQIQFGWSVDYYGIGDLVEYVAKVSDKEIDDKFNEYVKIYTLNTDNTDSVKEQIKYEIAIGKFLKDHDANAFTTNFEDLHGLKQLPGMAVQNLMKNGVGFGAEGDWKTSAMTACLKYGATGKSGATVFMEDYTYDYSEGNELELGSHMLEVDPSIASNRPKIEVHPLGIGGKEPPARLVFDSATGKGISVSIVDMGTNFKMIVQKLEMVKAPEKMPKLPVSGVMWKLFPDFKTATRRWIEEGGAHHMTLTNQYTAEEMADLAKLWGIPCVIIG